jgi:thiamine kinase-like enzyme
LHGDAHLGNVLRSGRELVWNDLEHVCRGPVEWDLACLAVTAVVLGRDRESTAEALSGYGSFDLDAVDRLIDLRLLEFAALKALDSPVDLEQLHFWLSVLERRLADRERALSGLEALGSGAA